jgi:hypothetical protein
MLELGLFEVREELKDLKEEIKEGRQKLDAVADRQEQGITMMLAVCERLSIDVSFPSASSAIAVPTAPPLSSPLVSLSGLNMRDTSATSSVRSGALSATSSARSGQSGKYLYYHPQVLYSPFPGARSRPLRGAQAGAASGSRSASHASSKQPALGE